MPVVGPVLFTDRLMLRPVQTEDLEPWARFAGDAENMRFLGGVQVRSVAWRSLCAQAGAWQIRGFSSFSVIERQSGQWIGRVGPWEPEDWPMPEIVYSLLPEFTGCGYATEAAAAAIDYAVEILNWTQVSHIIDPANAASIAVARRLGATNRGPVTLPSPMATSRVDCWAQTDAEWRARATAQEAG